MGDVDMSAPGQSVAAAAAAQINVVRGPNVQEQQTLSKISLDRAVSDDVNFSPLVAATSGNRIYQVAAASGPEGSRSDSATIRNAANPEMQRAERSINLGLDGIKKDVARVIQSLGATPEVSVAVSKAFDKKIAEALGSPGAGGLAIRAGVNGWPVQIVMSGVTIAIDGGSVRVDFHATSVGSGGDSGVFVPPIGNPPPVVNPKGQSVNLRGAGPGVYVDVNGQGASQLLAALQSDVNKPSSATSGREDALGSMVVLRSGTGVLPSSDGRTSHIELDVVRRVDLLPVAASQAEAVSRKPQEFARPGVDVSA